MKTLTFVSIVLLPSTLIAGIMGMNFKPALFDHPSLFFVTVAVIVGLMLVTLAVALSRGWIGFLNAAFEAEPETEEPLSRSATESGSSTARP